MNQTDFSILCDLTEKEKSWEGSIPFLAPPNTVDLVHLSKPDPFWEKKKQKAIPTWPKHTMYRFPEIYKGPDVMDDLVNQIKVDAKAFGGQTLQIRSSFRKKRCANGRIMSATLACQRSRLYNGKKTQDKSSVAAGNLQIKNTSSVTIHQQHAKKKMKSEKKSGVSTELQATTSRPLFPESCCAFQVTVFMSQDNFWYLATVAGTNMHLGHPKKNIEWLSNETKPLTVEDHQLITNMRDGGASDSEMARILSERKGRLFGANQFCHPSKIEPDQDSQQIQVEEMDNDNDTNFSSFNRTFQEFWKQIEPYPSAKRKFKEKVTELMDAISRDIQASLPKKQRGAANTS